MVGCSIKGCKIRSERKQEGITFHAFPVDSVTRKKWISATGRIHWIPTKFSRICSSHFERNLLIRKLKRTVLFGDAIPTLNINVLMTEDADNTIPATTFSKKMKETKRKSTAILCEAGGEQEEACKPLGSETYNNVCRVCLDMWHSNRLISLFRLWAPPWRSEQPPDDCIANQLAKLTGVLIEKSDGFPQQICQHCFKDFKNAYTFYYKVRHHDNMMRSKQLLVQSPSMSMSDLMHSWHKPIDAEPWNGSPSVEAPLIVPDVIRKVPTSAEHPTLIPEVEIKQEALSEDGDPSRLVEVQHELDSTDIKIEPEELIPQSHGRINGMMENTLTSNIVISSSYSMEPGSQTSSNLVKNASFDIANEPSVKEELDSDSGDVDSDLPLDCMLCPKQFHTVTGLKAHVISSHSYKSVMRKRAHINSKLSSQARDTENSSEGTTQRRCLDCGKAFTTSESLEIHRRVHSKSCERCGQNCVNFVTFAHHMRTCVAESTGAGDTQRGKTKTVQQLKRECAPEKTEEPAKRRKSTQQNYECSQCKEKFDEKIYLKIHNEVHHSISDTDTIVVKKEVEEEEPTVSEFNDIANKPIEETNKEANPNDTSNIKIADNYIMVIEPLISKEKSYELIKNIETADKELLESILDPDPTDMATLNRTNMANEIVGIAQAGDARSKIEIANDKIVSPTADHTDEGNESTADGASLEVNTNLDSKENCDTAKDIGIKKSKITEFESKFSPSEKSPSPMNKAIVNIANSTLFSNCEVSESAELDG